MSNRKRNGFTIVELLIVILVIAILAAVTIVAFNGVQSRAKISKKQSDMTSISKAAQAYNVTSSTPLALNNTSMTQAQIDAAIAALGLNSMKNSLVIDSGLALNNNACLQSPMTKDKYCLAISGPNARIVYWHDIQGKWIQRDYYNGGNTEVDVGTGEYPDAQVY